MIVASWLQSSAFSLTARATKVELMRQVARRMRQRLLAVAYQTSRRRLRILKMIRLVDRLRADSVPRGQGNI